MQKKEKKKNLMRFEGQQKQHISHVGYVYSFCHNRSMQLWKQFIMREREKIAYIEIMIEGSLWSYGWLKDLMVAEI